MKVVWCPNCGGRGCYWDMVWEYSAACPCADMRCMAALSVLFRWLAETQEIVDRMAKK